MQLSDKNIISDMRTAYGKALVELGSKDPNIVCVGADTTDSLKTKLFGDKFPNRLYNVGIAEANLVSIAAGLAIAGKVVSQVRTLHFYLEDVLIRLEILSAIHFST